MRITAEEAASMVRPGHWVDYGFGMGQPDAFDRALAARADLDGPVFIRAALSMRPRAVMAADPEGRRFVWLNWHFSGIDRRAHDAGAGHYIPMNFGEAPDLYRRFIEPVDVAVMKCCERDADGFYNFSGACTYHGALTERARCVVVEVDPRLPRVRGAGNGIHESRVDFVVETDGLGAPELAQGVPNDVDVRIARHVAGHVEDGACLQIGIGGLPNAVCTAILEAGTRDLGIHTEMLVDGLMHLIEAGRVTGARKRNGVGKAVFTFAGGSAALNAFIHDNPALESWPVDETNLPDRIMANPGVVSVNSTAQVDLQGQAASESAGTRHLTGTGGQLQFVRGAYASQGGKSFLCLPSTRTRRDGTVESRIVAALEPGTVVTTPRTDVMYVATEWGVVNLKGKSVPERVRALISVAHPDFREELARRAREGRMMPAWHV
ncbi:MAG: acetyl-CoA hydrolase/transferase C-terminal domain-containing protein [Verrucomicrobiota bacterium]|jgi:acyl-CoA hydrolase